jgi:hypothetical protein
MYGTIDRRAEADDMEQKGGANAPKAVEAVESVRLVASLKIANQAGNVHKGKQKATQPVIQLTPASLVAPQVTQQNASPETTVSMSSKTTVQAAIESNARKSSRVGSCIER